MSSRGQESEVFVISVAAELAGMHAQTLRTYDRLGLVIPQRTRGGGRRYSRRDVDLLREIQRLSQEEGVNLAGIKSIIELTQENERLKAENEQLRSELAEAKETASRRRSHGELVHVPRSTAVVMWEPRRRRKS
ncbi:MerR family transcriptional regulator [Corynebacterium hindlerae]|uniref:heat shock protein transcriptional repressor HspR n=1 Tax=Corynebacterium hindlerae TaxID=699041 RepID=UPI001AD7BB52|nr:MerR family transcriptional regulator [Corynebacterium hindlerae]QTH59594.1 MerR family transcriptional regulator [Corynebacterium hindlerae]